MKKQIEKNRLERQLKQEAINAEGELSRARSLTIGTAFGGVTEIMMRRPNGEIIWCTLQPVEVMELIHQLSANIGCHIKIVPRLDFSSWRDWRLTAEELEHYRGLQIHPAVGSPPIVNDMAPFNQLGATLPEANQQPGLLPISKTNVSVGKSLNAKIKKDFEKKLKKIENKEQQ